MINSKLLLPTIELKVKIYEKISEPEILPSASLRRGCSSGIALLHSKSSFFNASMIVLNPAKSAPCMSVMRELNTNTTGTIKINTKITVLKNAANTSYLRYFKSIFFSPNVAIQSKSETKRFIKKAL